MRLVVDTNILVSFAIRPNRTFERIFDHVANHGVLLISDETLTELADVLTRDKFRRYLPMVDATNFIAWYRDIAELVRVTRHVVACRDPRDDKFLSLAVSGRADFILAGDNDLLAMVEFEGVPIIAPSAFAGRLDIM